ncbi:MAG TPA: hypothetical protein VIX87_12840 [Steroidobacteraceae bacterium]
MSAAGAQRLLIGFDGAVECRLEGGPINLILRGLERAAGPASRTGLKAPGTAAEALFAAATPAISATPAATATDAGALAPHAGLAALPARLHEVELYELWAAGGDPDADPGRHILLCARELRLNLECRGLQLHRHVGRVFFGAVPPARVSWQRRLGWGLLLGALRLPGAGALLGPPRDEQ